MRVRHFLLYLRFPFVLRFNTIIAFAFILSINGAGTGAAINALPCSCTTFCHSFYGSLLFYCFLSPFCTRAAATTAAVAAAATTTTASGANDAATTATTASGAIIVDLRSLCDAFSLGAFTQEIPGTTTTAVAVGIISIGSWSTRSCQCFDNGCGRGSCCGCIFNVMAEAVAKKFALCLHLI